MASRKERIEQRDKKVYAMYKNLKKENINGVALYTGASISEKISMTFFLASETIEKIIVKHKKSNK